LIDSQEIAYVTEHFLDCKRVLNVSNRYIPISAILGIICYPKLDILWTLCNIWFDSKFKTNMIVLCLINFSYICTGYKEVSNRADGVNSPVAWEICCECSWVDLNE